MDSRTYAAWGRYNAFVHCSNWCTEQATDCTHFVFDLPKMECTLRNVMGPPSLPSRNAEFVSGIYPCSKFSFAVSSWVGIRQRCQILRQLYRQISKISGPERARKVLYLFGQNLLTY